MVTTNRESGTNVHEVADGIYRINTPMPPSFIPGGFSFNQYLLAGDEPLLFHTGLRKMFPLTLEAVRAVMPVDRLRYIGFSHFEADECGALNDWLSVAPQAQPVCSQVAAMVSVNDYADKPARAMGHQEVLDTGGHRLTWLDTPHLPHGWETGYFFDETTRTLLCGDLFTQPGVGEKAITEDDILEPSEASRAEMDYFSHSKHAPHLLELLAATEPTTLACMHGSAWKGDGAGLLRELSSRIT
ncbi:MBL fold metallo-hydrolase [Litorivivens sp.]|uniref:MBL fold metallo-hydrolase n=1 Tax=Litorivivens sp. TaxID=2020868 RepID=UPI003568015A